MAKKNIVPIRLYKLTNVPIDSLIDKCIEITTRPIVKVVNTDGVTSDDQSKAPILETKIKAAPRKAILYQKFLFLLHLIIYQYVIYYNRIYKKSTEQVFFIPYFFLLT